MKVICFGEILWDFLPAGLFAGGAPFNVGYHLHGQGAQVHLLSGIGRDLLGDELVRRLQHWGLSTEGLARHHGLPTGYVVATLGGGGDASYEFPASVAWDQILVDEDGLRAAVEANAIIYGSLAQRSTFNRAALQRLLTVMPTDAWRVFDVNLRAPHDDLALVRELASSATLLKLNSDEAARLAGSTTTGSEEAAARALADAHGCPLVCITAGARGAGLLVGGQWFWESGRQVDVVDTVGSGDAFLATLVLRLHAERHDPAAALARACRIGEWVATQRGATPAYASAPLS